MQSGFELSHDQASKYMILEFLGSKLSDCSSLQYIDNGIFFYSSQNGDSLLIQLVEQNSGNIDQPYIKVVAEYPSLGNIKDIQLLNTNSEKV